MGSEAWELERRYSVPGALDTRGLEPPASEDLHAWSIYRWVLKLRNHGGVKSATVKENSALLRRWYFTAEKKNVSEYFLRKRVKDLQKYFCISYGVFCVINYHSSADTMRQTRTDPKICFSSRQNLNSDFTDSALGSAEKSPLPYGNFQLRDSTVQSILRHPRYGPKSPLANNSFTYLKFGLPRVLPPSRIRDGSSGYDSSEEGRRAPVHGPGTHTSAMRSARSDPDFRQVHAMPRDQASSQINIRENPRLRSASEANLLNTYRPSRRHSMAPTEPGYSHGAPGSETFSMQVRPSIIPMQHPHLQFRGVEASGSNGLPLLRGISLEAGANEVLAVMATTEKEGTLIMETISGRRRIKRGDILLNGRSMSASVLRYLLQLIEQYRIFSKGEFNLQLVIHTFVSFFCFQGLALLTYPQKAHWVQDWRRHKR